jgi:hypothetical protein
MKHSEHSFAVHAIVDERTLWTVMRMLENARAINIMARPLPPAGENAEIDAIEPRKAPLVLPPPAPKKLGRPPRGESQKDVVHARLVDLVRGGAEIITSKMLRDKLDVPRQAVSNLLYTAKKAGHLKFHRKGEGGAAGSYVVTAKGRAALLGNGGAPPPPQQPAKPKKIYRPRADGRSAISIIREKMIAEFQAGAGSVTMDSVAVGGIARKAASNLLVTEAAAGRLEMLPRRDPRKPGEYVLTAKGKAELLSETSTSEAAS